MLMFALTIFSTLFILLPYGSQNSPASSQAAPSGVIVKRTDEMPTSPPTLTYKRDPQYTDEARKNNVEGTVVVRGTVGMDGKLHDPVVERSLGFGLDEKAIDCVTSWRFKPARKNWFEYETPINISVVFQLHPPAPHQLASVSGEMQLYSDPDGAFFFFYPKSLKLHPDNGGLPQVCIACLSYDRSLYPHSNFAGAEFWVDNPSQPGGPDGAQQQITSHSDCIAFYDFNNVESLPDEVIGGVSFARITWGGIGPPGTSSQVELFRNFHNGKCYELGIEVSIFSSAYNDEDYASGRVKRFAPQDQRGVQLVLEHVARTFHFVN